jgi:hypothetical protein
MEWIIETIREANGIDGRTLVATTVIQTGLKKVTAESYIKELLEFEVIYKKGGRLYVRKA